MCLLFIICYISKSPGGQHFELADASLPDPDPPSPLLDIIKNGTKN